MSIERFLSNFRRAPAGIERHGLGLWFQLLEDHFMSLFWANLFTAVALLPFFGCVYFVIATGDMLFWLGAVLFITLAGPMLTALQSVCARVALGMPVWLKEDYKASIKRDWKASLLLTAMVSLLWSALGYAALLISGVRGGLGMQYLVPLGVYAYFLMGFTVFSYQQLAMLDLPLGGIVKNSLLLIFAGKGRAVIAILLSMAVLLTAVKFWFYAILAAFIFLPALCAFTVNLILAPVFRELFMEDKDK